MDATSNDLTLSAIVSIISAIVTVIGASLALYKAKPERRKLDADSNASMAEAAESLASGTKLINDPLMNRIMDLEKREKKRDESERAWKLAWNAEMTDLKQKFEEMRLELDAYKDWALRLDGQRRKAGLDPVPFKPKETGTAKLF